ncbi:MAG: HAMP domain-containing sensor histidine kinase [Anaerolineae bacterium]|nr:HAMP domain-containing sensor histidine kinase [Anaerolineae bacterium]MDK1080077.1 HAMP domain-containing sensor histidine kinase [Anaerolineae bacterium]MDK1119392.1 HAMP domain-containing sensor histidine kinase [Anaerolineae bacterium]
MNPKDSLIKLRVNWLQHISHSMELDAAVRTNFEKELGEFFSLLIAAIANDDPTSLDPILTTWVSSPTQTDLEQETKNVSRLLGIMLAKTNEIAQEKLSDKESLKLLTVIIPIFTYALDKAARLEMDNRVSFVSNELYDVQQKLEQLDKTKSNFISVAAHELKTPLTLIEGYTAMIRELLEKSEEAQLENLMIGMDKGVDRLQEIINDMIDVSVIDNNLLSLNIQYITLNHVLKMLRTDLEKSFKARKQKLEINEFQGIETWLYADPERLFQAIRNVLVNAIKYTPDNGKISMDGRLLPGFIEITVKDNGIGIAIEHQSILFEKFAQFSELNLHSSGKTKFKGGGPGLGLPIARGIIEAHGGTIWVESQGRDEETNPGSIFHILLPIRTEAADPKVDKLFHINN